MSADSTGKGSNERWERLQQLFSQAVDLSGPDRKAFVEKETAGDAALRAELLELLACDNGGARTGPLTLALGAALDTTTRDRRKALVGRTLGNYKLVGVLGHGGTGTVYLGERADRQYSAQVAVKIVDNGTLQGELGLRFRAERQILASLNHPNIARLIDAGEIDVLEIDEALDRLADKNPRLAEMVELHYFGGLTYQELSETLKVSEATVDREIRLAKAWMLKEIRPLRSREPEAS
jgi:hypothetical protein